jgi:hypothetical protein
MLALRHIVLKLLTGTAALLAGCHAVDPGWQPLYGVEPPTEPPVPDLAFTSFTYEPASPVNAGEVITFTAALNKPFSDGSVMISIVVDDAQLYRLHGDRLYTGLLDNGEAPDAVAGDGVFTGSWQVPAVLGGLDGLPVIARVEWWSSAQAPYFFGEPLTVVDSTEEQP